jgi:hypothetical protein
MSILIHAIPDIKQDSISKVTKAKRTGGGTQVVEHLPSNHEAPSSNPSVTKKKKKKKKKLENFTLGKKEKFSHWNCNKF